MSGLWVWAVLSYCKMPRQQLQIAFPHHSVPDTLPSLEPQNWIGRRPYPPPRQTWQPDNQTQALNQHKTLKTTHFSLCSFYYFTNLWRSEDIVLYFASSTMYLAYKASKLMLFIGFFFSFNITFPPQGTLVQIILVMVSWRGFEKLFLLHLCSSIPSLSSWPKPCLIGGV